MGEDQQLVAGFPGASRCSRSGGWGSSARLGVGTSVSRDRGEGLIEAESCGGFRVWPETRRLGGWPVKLQLSRSCAAC